MFSLFFILELLSWAVPTLAQGHLPICVFSLASNGSILGQLPSGQVFGTQSTQNISVGEASTLFHLQQGRLYDTQMRGCWWVEPSTILVCDLVSAAAADPLFSLDLEYRLVYNSSRRDFWECPVDLGSEQPVGSGYYLDLPEDMEKGINGDEPLCTKVEIEAGLMAGWWCHDASSLSSSLSSPTTAGLVGETTASSGEPPVAVSWTVVTETVTLADGTTVTLTTAEVSTIESVL